MATVATTAPPPLSNAERGALRRLVDAYIDVQRRQEVSRQRHQAMLDRYTEESGKRMDIFDPVHARRVSATARDLHSQWLAERELSKERDRLRAEIDDRRPRVLLFLSQYISYLRSEFGKAPRTDKKKRDDLKRRIDAAASLQQRLLASAKTDGANHTSRASISDALIENLRQRLEHVERDLDQTLIESVQDDSGIELLFYMADTLIPDDALNELPDGPSPFDWEAFDAPNR